MATGTEPGDVVAANRHEIITPAWRPSTPLAPVDGVAHLLDHIAAMDDGRLDGRAVPG